jgi:hypothetical protein
MVKNLQTFLSIWWNTTNIWNIAVAYCNFDIPWSPYINLFVHPTRIELFQNRRKYKALPDCEIPVFLYLQSSWKFYAGLLTYFRKDGGRDVCASGCLFFSQSTGYNRVWAVEPGNTELVLAEMIRKYGWAVFAELNIGALWTTHRQNAGHIIPYEGQRRNAVALRSETFCINAPLHYNKTLPPRLLTIS